jgi:hypothetical protein
MACNFGQPSLYLRKKSISHGWKAMFIALGAMSIIFVLSQLYTILSASILAALAITAMIIFTIYFGYKFYREEDTTSENYFKGRLGEKEIFKELQKLPDDFAIFCDLVVKRPYNIDFTVLGPSGIFIVEAKNYPGSIDRENGKITVNGYFPKDKNFYNQAYAEKKSLEGYLLKHAKRDFRAFPIIVFSDDDRTEVLVGSAPEKGISVLHKKDLVGYIISKKQYLSDQDIIMVERNLLALKFSKIY